MSLRVREFETEAEAEAFLSGVEFVNDGAIEEAHVNEADPKTVMIWDSDYDAEDEHLGYDNDGNKLPK
jgi:hypothetical protein